MQLTFKSYRTYHPRDDEKASAQPPKIEVDPDFNPSNLINGSRPSWKCPSLQSLGRHTGLRKTRLVMREISQPDTESLFREKILGQKNIPGATQVYQYPCKVDC
jgi:hypothetical protein